MDRSTRGRVVLFGLLLVVALAAAVLSFAALRDLAAMCGFARPLAWLLPVVVDAGAAAGSLVWLGGHAVDAARRFARVLALALLGLSVAANALGHGLEAFRLAPPWWVVVAVSAIAPAVLGAVVHLAVLVGRTSVPEPGEPSGVAWAHAVLDPPGTEPVPEPPEPEFEPECEFNDGEPAGEQDTASRWWRDAAPVGITGPDRAQVLIAAGVGRRRLSRELDISEYEARQLLARSRGTTSGLGPADSNSPSSTDPTPGSGAQSTSVADHGDEHTSQTALAVGNRTGDRP